MQAVLNKWNLKKRVPEYDSKMNFAIYLLNTFQINIKDNNIEGKTVNRYLLKNSCNIMTSYYCSSTRCAN